MTILDIIKAIKIDFTQGVIAPETSSVLEYDFEITPKEFLNYSKTDFRTGDKRGNINALTNAKRAIDCQTDKIFASLGLNPNDFPSVIEEFIGRQNNSSAKRDIPIRLKFLQAINFAPVNIIANARLLRNKLEHYYKEPSNEEVISAIDLAELFILATDSKLHSLWDFYISDKKKWPNNDGYLWNSIGFSFNSQYHFFEVIGFIGKNSKQTLTINNECIEFYYLLKVATSFNYSEDVKESLVDFIKLIGHPIPVENISIEESYC